MFQDFKVFVKGVVVTALVLFGLDLILRTYHGYTAPSTASSKVGKVFMQYGPVNPVYERALSTHRPHDEKFGYPIFLLRSQTLPDYWSKTAYILKILIDELEKPSESRLEWLFWFDSDIVLMNPNIPLEIFLPPNEKWSHIHVLISQDHRGLNNGCFGIRVHEYSVWLLSATLSIKTYLPDIKLKIGDQSALEYWLQSTQFRNGTMHMPQRWFNAYAGYRGRADYSDPLLPQRKFRPNSIKEGDILVHHAGHKQLRMARMEPWVAVAEQHLPQWELELSQTTYLQEIQKFWENEADKEYERVTAFREASGYHYL
ncbi:hypothetical protein B0A52_02162 [Exophiala mesophila]|uniref:Galactosyl transferase GMA12/MNN10 family protein n=1 Tax=Exophiala mesophila TaxID=212818 RepID=A0A438NB88_EXOME|nr:hypothetical protein B0A52_02162 [Exophiala mesophila]